MTWDFRTEPEFEEKLEWIRWFRAERVEPLDLLYPGRAFHPLDDETGPVVRALKQQVRDQGLWAPHLGPELGGRGFGQRRDHRPLRHRGTEGALSMPVRSMSAPSTSADRSAGCMADSPPLR